jgi:hypothetical protein
MHLRGTILTMHLIPISLRVHTCKQLVFLFPLQDTSQRYTILCPSAGSYTFYIHKHTCISNHHHENLMPKANLLCATLRTQTAGGLDSPQEPQYSIPYYHSSNKHVVFILVELHPHPLSHAPTCTHLLARLH